jgi:hypothetical protein
MNGVNKKTLESPIQKVWDQMIEEIQGNVSRQVSNNVAEKLYSIIDNQLFSQMTLPLKNKIYETSTLRSTKSTSRSV